MSLYSCTRVVISLSLVIITTISGCLTENRSNSSHIGEDSSLTKIIVDDEYTSSTPGWGVTRFNSIQEAIEKSMDNSTIFVHSGVYREKIVIEKRITLIGEDANTTIISGEGSSEDVILVTDKGRVVLKGFTIRDSGYKGEYPYNEAGIDIKSDHNIICDNIFINNTCGIYTMYSDHNIICRNKFVNNTQYGAYLYTSSDNDIIENNIFYHNKYALRIKGSAYNNVSKNIFLNNTHGLYLCCGSHDNIIFCNIFKNNEEWDALDSFNNKYDNGSCGNFWYVFHTPEQGAYDENGDGLVDSVFNIEGGGNVDNYPLSHPPTIDNPFYKEFKREIEKL